MLDNKINDCWNTIGVWGDEEPRCPELKKIIHCHNCPVYSNAGRLLLDRETDKAYLNEWTSNLKKPRNDDEHSQQSALSFRLGEEWFALPSGVIREITQCDKHHSLPHRKNQILRGLVNVRGDLLLSVSLGYLFKLQKTEGNDHKNKITHERYVVISDNGELFAFPVSEVKDTLKYDPDDLQNTPSTVNNTSSNFIKGVIEQNETHIGLLDSELLFSALHRNIS
jgi:chemotaxis-related protein WspD